MKRLAVIQAASKLVRGNPLVSIGLGALLLAAAAATYMRFTHTPPPPSIASLVPAGSPPSTIASPRPTHVITFAQGCLDSGCHAALATAPVVHAPAASHACEQCHAPDAGGHRYPILRTGAALCTACHDQTLSLGAHPGTQDQSCLECHTPHASQAPGLLRGTSTQATCNSCHQTAHDRTLHAPFAAGTCNACHDPHADKPTTGPEQCSSCHQQIATQATHASHTHRTLDGGCIACHAPHGAANPKLLAASTRETCGSCHALAAESQKDTHRSHNGVLKDVSCVKCHDAHGSNNTAMLLHSQKAVCLECHSKPIAASNGRTIESMEGLTVGSTSHGAISHGECSACHSMHGASHEQAVKLVNQQVPLGPFDVANYALCFSCHDTALTQSWSATQFRDGQVNLHQLHLTRGGDQDHSRGCTACHAVHQSNQPRLIATTVNFEGSGWKMPMGFTLTPQGGTCGSSCHVPMTYSRQPGGARAATQGGSP
jgi:predicted CXXCH cytochrome family protein